MSYLLFVAMLTLQAYERAGFSAFEMTMLEDFESSLKNQAAHRGEWRYALNRQ